MRRPLLLGLTLLLAGCGASSTGSLGAAQPSPVASVVPPPVPRPTQASPAGVATTTGTTTGTTGGTATAGTATAGTATAGPGHLSSPAPSPSPRPTPTATAGTVTVTDADSGATVRLAVGQHLRVELSSGTWDPPASSADGVVVRRSSRGGYPTDQPVDATFDAVSHGTADVTAQSDAACFHTQPRCMMAQREWRVTVLVR